jgi:hypothetical protein
MQVYAFASSGSVLATGVLPPRIFPLQLDEDLLVQNEQLVDWQSEQGLSELKSRLVSESEASLNKAPESDGDKKHAPSVDSKFGMIGRQKPPVQLPPSLHQLRSASSGELF